MLHKIETNIYTKMSTYKLILASTNSIVVGIMIFAFTSCLVSCYHSQPKANHTSYHNISDTVCFEQTHHYSLNYNFIVKKDSLVLLRQQPEELLNNMMTDSVTVYRYDHIVVADIRIIPSYHADSVWIQVARDQQTFGWTRESSLLKATVPSDPISQFISIFSDSHLLVFLIIISIISAAYLMRTLLKRNARIVHFNDIGSFYPTLLALIVATSATLYSSIQNFEADMWRHFYFNPTLNPLDVPFVLAVFLSSVWAMLVIALAVADSVRRMLQPTEALLYLSGLAGVCALNYIIFSITTLYYIGYPLLVAYAYYAIKRYFCHTRCRYICGNCGARLKKKGICQQCGAMNT